MNALKTVELSQEQQAAINFVVSNLDSGLVAISGPAGSGKTTLIKELVRILSANALVTVAAPTNKAARVLQSKGVEDAVTMHSACLRPIFHPPLDKLATFLEQALVFETLDDIDIPKVLAKEFTAPKLRAALDVVKRTGVCSALRQLGIKDIFKHISAWLPALPREREVLILDEGSMVGDDDLAAARTVFSRIVIIGDENQLPPVKGTPVFWTIECRFALTQIHRHAAGSQPLEIATRIRNCEPVTPKPLQSIDIDLCRQGVPIIVWKNTTRIALTLEIRKRLGYDGLPPQVGEVLVCRGGDREAKHKGLITNSTWTVLASDGFICTLESPDGQVIEDEHTHLEEMEAGEGVNFRFGYVLTCHTCQGSQFPRVMIHQPDTVAFYAFKKEEAKRFLYTAATRAEKEVIWVNGKVA